MRPVYVRCTEPRCEHRSIVECRATDQALHCSGCGALGTFVNLGAYLCGGCGHNQTVPLAMCPTQTTCERCGQTSAPLELDNRRSHVTYWRMESHEALSGNHLIQGCRMASFSESEHEVEIAKGVLERIYPPGGVLQRVVGGKHKAMFIRWSGLSTLPGSTLPVPIRSLHAYCNFRWSWWDSYNAKFCGNLTGFVHGWPFELAVDECGCRDVLLCDQELYDELSRFPTLDKYKHRFKVV